MMKRIQGALLVIALAALAYGVYLWNIDHFHLGYWLQVHTGTINEPGPYYGFWSGFGSDIGEATIVTAVFSTVAHSARVNNCEVHGCWRLGRHATAAGHKVCRKHHPDDVLTAEQVVTAHNEALSNCE